MKKQFSGKQIVFVQSVQRKNNYHTGHSRISIEETMFEPKHRTNGNFSKPKRQRRASGQRHLALPHGCGRFCTDKEDDFDEVILPQKINPLKAKAVSVNQTTFRSLNFKA